MGFPIYFSGTFRVAGVSADEAMSRIAKAVTDARPRSVRREGNRLHFDGWSFSSPGEVFSTRFFETVPVHLVSRGVVDVAPAGDGTNVRYSARIFSFGFVTAVFAFGVLPFELTRPNLTVARALAETAFPWLFMVAFAFIATRIQVSRFLFRTASRPS